MSVTVDHKAIKICIKAHSFYIRRKLIIREASGVLFTVFGAAVFLKVHILCCRCGI